MEHKYIFSSEFHSATMIIMINQQVTQYQWIFAPKIIECFQVCQSMKHSLKLSNVSIDCNNDLEKILFFSLTLSEGKNIIL